MLPRSDLDISIEHAVLAATDRIEPAASGVWRVTTLNEPALDVRTRLVGDEWLEMAGPSLAVLHEKEQPWPLLSLNARLSGATRLASRPDGLFEVRADLFVGIGDEGSVGESVSLEERVAALRDDMRAAHRAVSTFIAGHGNDSVDEPAGRSEQDERLARLCAEAGWPGSRNGSGGVNVWLDTGTPGVHACLALSGQLQLHAVAPLSPTPTSSDASRAAVALLLLRLSSAVRGVKGLVVCDGGQQLPAVASAWERPLRSPGELDRALSALAVAYGLVQREVQALQDETLARDYLELRQPTSMRAQKPTNTDALEGTPCLQLPY